MENKEQIILDIGCGQKKFETSHQQEILKQIEYIELQYRYISGQKEFIHNHKLETSIIFKILITPPLNFIQNGNLYADKNAVLYLSIDVFWQYQKMINLLQSIIDNR